MKYLLDTHAVIWYFENSLRLPGGAKEIIDNNDTSICLCTVSLWEIAIKISSGKLKLSLTFEEFLDKIKEYDFELLQIGEAHLKKLTALPFLHKDPFDRLLIATALVENLTIITADDNIHKYDVSCFWSRELGKQSRNR